MSGPGKSKNGTGKIHSLPGVGVPETGQEGREISPAETTGSLPPDRVLDSASEEIMEGIGSGFGDTGVLPMGFNNGNDPEYPMNVCYRNSVKSMLLNIPTFSNWLTSYLNRQEVRQYSFESSPDNTPAPIVMSLAELNQLYWTPEEKLTAGSASKQDLLDQAMDVFFQAFVNARPGFDTNQGNNHWRQEDADDFLVEFLASMDTELDPYV